MTFAKWTGLFILTYGALEAMFVGLCGVYFGFSARQLFLPYFALITTAFVTGPLMYWAQKVRGQPKSFALRLAFVGTFGCMLFAVAVGFCAIRLRLLSTHFVLYECAPCALVGAVIVAVTIFRSVHARAAAYSRIGA